MEKNRTQIIFEDVGYAKLDPHRKERTGLPEAVFCQGKKAEEVGEIIKTLSETSKEPIIGTKATELDFLETQKLVREAKYFKEAKIILVNGKSAEDQKEDTDGATLESKMVAVITGGTADIGIAEEAAVTLEAHGIKVAKFFDVGVAGLERLLSKIEEIKKAKVIIAVAGMEGALPSVLGGLVLAPIIAVPTSVGYGANFEGLSALLSMLNSCSPGTGVVNIDNGFGAACLAIKILKV